MDDLNMDCYELKMEKAEIVGFRKTNRLTNDTTLNKLLKQMKIN